jgi:hypothetical protein
MKTGITMYWKILIPGSFLVKMKNLYFHHSFQLLHFALVNRKKLIRLRDGGGDDAVVSAPCSGFMITLLELNRRKISNLLFGYWGGRVNLKKRSFEHKNNHDGIFRPPNLIITFK